MSTSPPPQSPTPNSPGRTDRRTLEIASAFLKLGLISFGGPIAHLGYFHAEFVRKRRWLDDAEYADLVALCQSLPGPASSQVAFGLGMRRGGIAGAAAASVCFTTPSALLMIAFAYGMASLGSVTEAGWMHGLKLAAVAVVAQAVWSMGRSLCPDVPRVLMGLTAAGTVLWMRSVWVQVGVIAVCALAGWALYRGILPETVETRPAGVANHKAPTTALLVFAVLLIGSPLLARETDNRWVNSFDAFYRSGSLVFGGGHVVLPLLREQIVPRGWMDDGTFLAGYAGAQALPGPLFTFSAYLGTIIFEGPGAWRGGVWCLIAVFLPAWLLVGGVLPFWPVVRATRWVQAGLRGANAAVVGILLAAWYSPVMTQSVHTVTDGFVATTAIVFLMRWRVPPLLIVLGCAATGLWPPA
ncbi:MAG: chromate efflux transporter [Planctomycetes bacterium]|nr:chromate efflux transporter [Planctomycetota bacterium]